jgi:hypothetical protein
MIKRSAICLAIAACASPQATAPKPVTVHLSSGSSPVSGIDVLFSGRSGELIAHRQTDARGAAEANAGGGSVTIATYDGELESYELFTIAGVEPADQIRVDLSAYALPKPVAMASLSFPERAAGAQSYQAVAGCSGGSSADPAKLPLLAIQPWCLVDGRFDVFARAVDAEGRPIAYTFLADVAPLTSSMSIALPAWRTDFVPISLSTSPSDAKLRATIDAVAAEITARGDLASSPFPKTMSIPASLSQKIDLTVIEDGEKSQRVVSRVQDRSPSLVFDTKDFLPAISISIQGSDQPRPTISVAFDSGSGDGLWAGMSWGQPKPRLNWTLLLPPQPASFRMPELPPALSAFSPSGEARGGIATLFDRGSIDRWSQLRSVPTSSMRWAVTRAPQDQLLRFSQARR